MQTLLDRFIGINYKIHLGLAFLLRIVLIIYGVYHDQISSVSYTDVDYRVFTDAARHVLAHRSPYERHTYRYSPIMAYLTIPNILLHHTFGKILFSLIDIINALLIRAIIQSNMLTYHSYMADKTAPSAIMGRNRNKRSKSVKYFVNEYIINASIIVWLYNPLTVAIATRGNSDSIAAFLVLATLYMLQCKKKYFCAGFIHGISIHFRLYPLVYSLAYFMYLSNYSFYSIDYRKKTLKGNMKELTAPAQNKLVAKSSTNQSNNEQQNQRMTIFKKDYVLYLIPNFDQIRLVQGCILSLFSLIGLFYYLYGYKFIHETYIFHLVRKDYRHNFSLYFYLQYLTAWIKNVGIWQKVLTILPQIVLLLVFSIRYGLNRLSLNFSIVTQTIVMVTYNTVLTSQYFVWILAVLPLCLWQIQMSKKNALFLLIVWFAAQGAWLLPAYLLEFHGQNTFMFIWIQSVSFFCANIAILGRLILYFMPMKEKLV